MERVWNGHPAQHHCSGIAFDGLERRGLERNSGTGSGALDRDVRSPLFRTFHIER